MNKFDVFLEELEIAAACQNCGEVSFETLFDSSCPYCAKKAEAELRLLWMELFSKLTDWR